ncbi:MAG TPA: MBL fold metallo-hydrolase [Ilumatobacteraceae bacterium]|jgi:7,8-dihydropterin-6-yl-methyl-4-(beta-D-ribofuranosyl)aminobenzene 5'-phosphate synthase|nr:MBL fold metallo-hydrolase [Ilumatobacteraceae bacterium]
MCDDHGHDHDAVGHAVPRAIEGDAVDPITLEPVDEVIVTMLMDNSYDGLLGDSGPATRNGLIKTPGAPSSVMLEGETKPGLVAEHGFSALVAVRRGSQWHTVLFDTGISPHGMADNMERLGIDATDIEAVVLSHGHFDHAGGLEGLAKLRRRSGLPIVVHPMVWSQRRLALPEMPAIEMPTVSKRSLENEGFEVIERRQRSLLLDGSVLITGEVDRTTDFETGFPFHERLGDDGWEPDPLILDDQALIVHVRGKGLLVLTGCGHAGAVNIARYAMRLTGVDRLHAMMGGFHLGGPAFERIIEPTVVALASMAPAVIVPAHCTGWKAQHRFAASLSDSFIPNAVGTSYTLAADAA